MLRLVPRQERFYDLLDQTADLVASAAHLLLEMLEHFDRAPELAKRIWQLEKDSDEVTDDIVLKANETFVTPMDREDIQSIARIMDRTLNYINSVAYRVEILKLKDTTPHLVSQAQSLVMAADAMRQAVVAMRKNPDEALRQVEAVNHIETEGDARFREALAALFENTPDSPAEVLELLKLKEIHERIDAAIDRCEDVADTIEGIMVKNA